MFDSINRLKEIELVECPPNKFNPVYLSLSPFSTITMVEIVEPKVTCNLEVDDHGLDPTFLYYRPEGTRFHSNVGSKQVRSIPTCH